MTAALLTSAITLDDDEARWIDDAVRVEIGVELDLNIDVHADTDRLREQLTSLGQLAALVGVLEGRELPATADVRQVLVRLRDVQAEYLAHDQELRRRGDWIHDEDLASNAAYLERADRILARFDATAEGTENGQR